MVDPDDFFGTRRDESAARRTGPIATGHCSVPVMTIENMGVWALLRDMCNLDDYWFAEKYGYWIPKDGK
jgi:hypothetical protein